MQTLSLRYYWLRIYSIAMLALLACTSQACQNFGEFWKVGDAPRSSLSSNAPLQAELASGTVSAANASAFIAVKIDSGGNIYAGGRQYGTGSVSYGGSTISGAFATNENLALVKYSAAGSAIWARTATVATHLTLIMDLAIDNADSVITAGTNYGSGNFNYGSGIITGGNNATNPALVKYDAAGNTLWARSVTGGSANSRFSAVSVDNAGNIFAGGYVDGLGAFNFSGQVTSGIIAGRNIVLVKYDTNGTALWARGVSSGAQTSDITAVAVDSASGDLIAAGQQNNAGTLNYGGITVTSTYNSGNNLLLLRLNSAGTYLWGRSVQSSSNVTILNSVAVAATGEIFGCGFQTGNTIVDYGGISATGGHSTGNNFMIIKFTAGGNPVWVRTVSTASATSQCNRLAIGSDGTVIAVGHQGAGQADYGGVTITSLFAGDNSIITRFTSGGTLISAVGATVANGAHRFTGVATGGDGTILAVGNQSGNSAFSYGGSTLVSGAYAAGENAVIVKYR